MPQPLWGISQKSPNRKMLLTHEDPSLQLTEAQLPKDWNRQDVHRKSKTLILALPKRNLIGSINRQLTWPIWSPDSTKIAAFVATSEMSSYLKIFNLKGIEIKSKRLRSAASWEWAPDSKSILVTEENEASIVYLTDAPDKILERQLNRNTYDRWSNPSWSNDSSCAAATVKTGERSAKVYEVKVWNVRSGRTIFSLRGDDSTARGRWSPNGKLFVTSDSRYMHFLDAATYKERSKISVQNSHGTVFHWSHDGRYLAYKENNLIHICRMWDKKIVATIDGPASGNFRFSWAPDDTMLLLSTEGTLALCDATSGRYLGHQTVESPILWFDEDGTSIKVYRRNAQYEPIPLASKKSKHKCVLKNGKPGSPGWENYPSPENLDACFAFLDRTLSFKERQTIKNCPEEETYWSLRTTHDQILKNIGLFKLRRQFNALGKLEYLDEETIISKAYWLYLNGKQLDLNKIVASVVRN